jgi:coenzyme F420-reducing hydrogenase alpha subunit
MTEERTYKVDLLARVEGEGRFWLHVDEHGQVVEAKLNIFEAPRFFEALLRGRSLFEVPDLVARICGICPVAYQTSSTRALERILGIDPLPDPLRALRRLLYCGEWIESHALHVFMLHAPDLLGYHSAIEMAVAHKSLVERGLQLKRLGNQIMEVLGGRAIHPVSVRVGGFTRTPTRAQLLSLREPLRAGLELADDSVDWANGLDVPAFRQDYVCVALAGDRYPIEHGDELVISGRAGRGGSSRIHVDEFPAHFEEQHVGHSNALQCRLRDGTPYFVGPIARLNHHAELLHPRAAAALARTRLRLPIGNPFQGIVVRMIEIVHAFAEAIDIIDAYAGQIEPGYREGTVKAGHAAGCSEAPRGICWHHYAVDDEGLIVDAQIVPPTSQNQARIEADLVAIAPQLLALEHESATRECEQLIRSYDPCISCATHFLKLEIQR